MTDLPDIKDTDMSPAIDDIVALIQRLDDISPNWRRLEMVKNGAGEAILWLFDEDIAPADHQGAVLQFRPKSPATSG
jgi:hypothetical protein